MNSEERLKNLSVFLDTVENFTDVNMINDLYRTIIDSIEYENNGDGEVRLKVIFK